MLSTAGHCDQSSVAISSSFPHHTYDIIVHYMGPFVHDKASGKLAKTAAKDYPPKASTAMKGFYFWQK
jgi:hypothetical protein